MPRLQPSGPSPFQPLHCSSHIPTNHSPSWGLCTHPPPPASCPEWSSSAKLIFCQSLLKCTVLKRLCLTLLFQRSTPTPQCHIPFITAYNCRYLQVCTCLQFCVYPLCVMMPVVISGSLPHPPPPGALGQVAEVTLSIKKHHLCFTRYLQPPDFFCVQHPTDTPSLNPRMKGTVKL